MQKFNEYFSPSANPIFSCYVFHKQDQNNIETVEQYATDLKLLVCECEYSAAIHDEMVKDRLICGVKSPKIHEKLLQMGPTLILPQAITTARVHTETQAQLKLMSTAATSNHKIQIKQEIDFVQYNKQSKGPARPNMARRQDRYLCCGDYSPMHKCPAKGKICSKCNKMNHFAKVCRSGKKSINKIESNRADPHDVRYSDDELFIHEVSIENADDQPYSVLHIDQQISIRFKVDTGAQANILTKSLLNNIKHSPQIHPTRQILTSFCGQKIPVLGTCQLFCSHSNGNSDLLTFFIVEEAPTPILGFVASCKLQLIKCIFTLNKSSDDLFLTSNPHLTV